MKRINKDKIYNFIGRAVVYSSLYIATVAFSVWGFLQGMTYQEVKDDENIFNNDGTLNKNYNSFKKRVLLIQYLKKLGLSSE